MEGTFEAFISVAVGISLAASAGLRAFLPLFVAGLFSRVLGDTLPLSESFDWLRSTPALVALGVAVVIEVAADKVPALDHLLDTIQAPVRTVAGMVALAAVAADVPAWIAAPLAIVVGGGAALSVHATKSMVRVGSTATTAGVGNPIRSLGEDLIALVVSTLSIVLWVVALVVAVLTLGFVVVAVRWVVRRRRARLDAAGG